MVIRLANLKDAPAIFAIVRAASLDDEALPFREMTDEACMQHWFGPHQAWVACDAEGRISGVYKLGENYPDRGAHVASATYIVDATARGRGIGRALVEHSLEEASRRGFKAIQFNCVVSSNAPAVALYRKLGFSIVGCIPAAFHDRRRGLVDVFVMHRFLPAANGPLG